MTKFLGITGLFSKTPFMNLTINGCAPILVPVFSCVTADTADLAVLMALNFKPVPNKSAKNSSTSFTPGAYGEEFLSLENLSHLEI